MSSATSPHLRKWMPRATRFTMNAEIHYRTMGDHEWLEGRTKDVSKTGVLFLAGRPLQTHSQIRMRLKLPVVKSSEFKAEIACAGRIVRVVKPEGEDAPFAIAARIASYRFVRRGAEPNAPLSP